MAAAADDTSVIALWPRPRGAGTGGSRSWSGGRRRCRTARSRGWLRRIGHDSAADTSRGQGVGKPSLSGSYHRSLVGRARKTSRDRAMSVRYTRAPYGQPGSTKPSTSSRSAATSAATDSVPKLISPRSYLRPPHVLRVLRDQLCDNPAGHGHRATDAHGRCHRAHLHVPARPVTTPVASGRRGRVTESAYIEVNAPPPAARAGHAGPPTNPLPPARVGRRPTTRPLTASSCRSLEGDLATMSRLASVDRRILAVKSGPLPLAGSRAAQSSPAVCRPNRQSLLRLPRSRPK
jgi:hypothetical protein